MIYKIWKESGIFENAIRVGGFSSIMYIVYGWQCANILGIDRHLEYIDNPLCI